MSEFLFSTDKEKKKLDLVSNDILKNVGITRSFILWMGFLVTALLICLYAYSRQLRHGLSVTGLRDITSWGLYIANFVFFVATSLVGMLISSVLGLAGARWIKPITRIAEVIAVGFSAVAGLVIVSDMGRPDRLPYVFMFGRVQSPILWDVSVVTTYFVLSLLLWFIPMIPDLEIARTRLENRPSFLVKAYKLLSFKWIHHESQYKILKQAITVLLILIVPMAFAIHTVTSWLFAVTLRAGWDSTNFGPYFISGAFVSGTSALIIAMYVFRTQYKLHNYITDDHFDKIGKILVLVSIIYVYFNLNEFLVPEYKLKAADAVHLRELFSGTRASLFWGVQLGCLVIPTLILLFRKIRKPAPMLIISCIMLAGAWLKRFIIVVPPQAHPFLPPQYYPRKWIVYTPTLTEVLITVASFILVLIIITILTKLFPVVPIWEIAAEEAGSENSANP